MDILLIEDNPGDVLLIQTSLMEVDHLQLRIVVKSNGLDAAVYINKSEHIPDLIILDVNLPQRDGFELLEEIKAKEKYNNIPVVFFTSSDNERDKSKALGMGAKAYIIKSVDYDEYKNQVVSFLSHVQLC